MEEKKVCEMELIDGEEVELCRCPEEEVRCTGGELACQVEVGENGEDIEVCKCPGEECAEEDRVCTTEVNAEGV